jgi:hypothetical protein
VGYKGCWYSREEAPLAIQQHARREQAARKARREEWLASEGGKLCLAFYQAFQAYKNHVTQNAQADSNARDMEGKYQEEHALFATGLRVMSQHAQELEETRRKNLEKAKRAARCQHMHVSGEQCGSPRVRGRKLCYMHERMEEARTQKLDLGPMEDPDSIQVAIRKLQSAIIEGTLDNKQVGQLAYTIQLAAWNVTRTTDRRERA